MSSALTDGSPCAVPVSSYKQEKKHKREKKRAREEDEGAAVEDSPRKHKKSKSESRHPNEAATEPIDSVNAEEQSSKKTKKKHQKQEATDVPGMEQSASEEPRKKSKKVKLEETENESKQERKKAKNKKHSEQDQVDAMDVDPPGEAVIEHDGNAKHQKIKKPKKDSARQTKLEKGAIEVDSEIVASQPEQQEQEPKKKRKSKESSKEKKKRAVSPEVSDSEKRVVPASTQETADLPTDPSFPLFTQTISLYVPFFPVGFDKPLTNIAAQHLDPLLNHYSPMLRGVLLGYSNLNLSEQPARANPKNPPTDQTPALLHSVDEYAVGFGWLTFDARLFVPSRGSWMEGVVQLQSEGHVGVVCWNKFNASIEARRLPKGWKWVDLAKKGTRDGSSSLPSPDWNEGEQEQGQEDEEDALDGEELQVVEQMHTTGYWINERGRKVSGKLRFRIKNFDVGLAGNYGYLSIEGTCLDDDAERALAAEERDNEKRRRNKQNPTGLLRPLSRRVPEFSMTKFGKEDQEEDSRQRTVLYKGSRPGTPDD
ncbi:DNA-directed RNA polymerase I subunit RPA43 [Diplogelasinospora grovesii]|uniref:DNA-directed RNA polymerase subunit n=1 Tax=Diplogelasinospora grovesii TaxID=303347 RepID=A0AAN6MWS1_9PEZI|nr:DNA-directed RNA polymerase I subunit RPA43 [Diplogelasinospora grovesii]